MPQIKYGIPALPEEGYWECYVCKKKIFPDIYKKKPEPDSKYWNSINQRVYCNIKHSMIDMIVIHDKSDPIW